MKLLKNTLLALVLFASMGPVSAQNSVAHEWAEVSLEAVRKGRARPTVIARNLYHTSIALYDAWAVYDSIAVPYFLGDSLGDYPCEFNGVPEPADVKAAQEMAMSYAAYRIIKKRYTASPSQTNTYYIIDTLMAHLGYDPSITSTDYSSGDPAALGNYIGTQLIAAGLADGANEQNNYANQYYNTVNSPLVVNDPGNPNIDSLNRYQYLSLPVIWDQSCSEVLNSTPPFLSPEWGNVVPFALDDSVKTVKSRDGNDWIMFHDPGTPPRIGMEGDLETDLHRWGMETVAVWSSHLDHTDGVNWDISPANIGNIDIETMPDDFADYDQFYNFNDGGDPSPGHALNPYTNLPYEPQIVPRGDYTRILAEFWADGPDSEAPPGHWYAIYNEIKYYPDFTWKWEGQGDPLDHLEYDVKVYLTLGGAVHDAAVASWAAKGYYDYIRPVSSIRAIAELGQSSDTELPNFHPAGFSLIPGAIEQVAAGDPLEGESGEHIGKIKLKCWLGPFPSDTCVTPGEPLEFDTAVAGVGWKLAENWWPYQRPTFVSPPFAGYVSGHSTFSRAAAEVMTLTTGDRFFPGGMGVFTCPENEFLVFENGPSMDIHLQWATYQDASDQCSLSRIWGGIHPPQDDIPGRKMGFKIGHHAFELANRFFVGGLPSVTGHSVSTNLITDADVGNQLVISAFFTHRMDLSTDPTIGLDAASVIENNLDLVSGTWTDDTTFTWTYDILDNEETFSMTGLSIQNARSLYGGDLIPYSSEELIYFDTKNPSATVDFFQDAANVSFTVSFDEPMNTSVTPLVSFPVEEALNLVLAYNSSVSTWVDTQTYVAVFDILEDEQLFDIDFEISTAADSLGNDMISYSEVDAFSVDTKDPFISEIDRSSPLLYDADAGSATFNITVKYDEGMDSSVAPVISFPFEDPTVNSLIPDPVSSDWADDSTYVFVFDVIDAEEELADIDVEVSAAKDLAENEQTVFLESNLFSIDTKNPSVVMAQTDDLITTTDILGGMEFQISFDEEMDISATPSLLFPLEDPSSGLSPLGGSWDINVFTASFDVLDSGLDLSGVDLQIMDAKDLAGNEVIVYDSIDLFDIELSRPAVASIDPDVDIISDLNDGGTLILTISFDEELDNSTAPLVSFPVEDPGPTLALNSVNWIDAQTIELALDINDMQLDMQTIDVEVSMAVDAAGNTMENQLIVDVFSIDMLNPSAISVSPSVPVIDNSFIGSGTFGIDIEFSEEMDTMFPASIGYPVEDPGTTLAVNDLISGWVSTTTYQIVFDVSEGLTVLPDIDINAGGPVDVNFNQASEELFEDVFSIDIASGIDENGIAEMIQVFPNPVVSGVEVTLIRHASTGLARLSLIDALGREHYGLNLDRNSGELISLSTADLSTGTYLLLLSTENGTYSQRLIIAQ